MQSNGRQAADFLQVLYPTLQVSGLSTKIACCDGSGWEQNRAVLTGIQQAGYEYTLDVVSSHGYSSRPGVPFNTIKRTCESTLFLPSDHTQSCRSLQYTNTSR